MRGNCGKSTTQTVPGTSVKLYSAGHDPASMYAANETCEANNEPLTSDSQLSDLRDFTYIVPNMCDDMHTYSTTGTCPAYFGPVSGADPIQIGDAWLSHVVPLLLIDPSESVIVTFDEGDRSTGERVYAVELGSGVSPGTTDDTFYNYYGLLSGIYGALGLGTAPNNAASATPVPIGFAQTLSVGTAGADSGSVTSSVGGISCTSPNTGTCSQTFAQETTVSLTAAPSTGSTFGQLHERSARHAE